MQLNQHTACKSSNIFMVHPAKSKATAMRWDPNPRSPIHKSKLEKSREISSQLAQNGRICKKWFIRRFPPLLCPHEHTSRRVYTHTDIAPPPPGNQACWKVCLGAKLVVDRYRKFSDGCLFFPCLPEPSVIGWKAEAQTSHKENEVWGLAQLMEYLPSSHETLGLIFRTI